MKTSVLGNSTYFALQHRLLSSWDGGFSGIVEDLKTHKIEKFLTEQRILAHIAAQTAHVHQVI